QYKKLTLKLKIFNLTTLCCKQDVYTLKEQLEAEKLEKVSMKAEIYELKVLVQQLINEKPEQP
ncbi:hypothetical protein P4H55_31770, partial [Bacillus cereus]|nr:hypothetical protein [Bacillus cereus]